MGQIISYMWRWIRPKKKIEKPKNDDHQTNYQPINSVDEPENSHYIINISDHASSTAENVGNHDHDVDLVPSTTDIVVDLGSEYQEVVNKKKRKKKTKKPDQVDLFISKLVTEKSVATSTPSHVPSNVKKIGQYTSSQKILLVGEGDFSFSACLAMAFGNAANITATSLNSYAFLVTNYGSFIANWTELVNRGSMVLHDVNATNMSKHPVLGSMVFDRIIFNFPHAGRFGHSETELRAHQKLIRGFFRNAKKMIEKDGEIHITSKSNGFYLEWDIPKIGSDHNLCLIEEIKFRPSKYPGYNTKYGFGGDRDFDSNPSKTYKFGLSLK
ncbi:hypothetical protein RDABS01_032061 [Bienertia sinuspersici]